jgi:hypothetical protein
MTFKKALGTVLIMANFTLIPSCGRSPSESASNSASTLSAMEESQASKEASLPKLSLTSDSPLVQLTYARQLATTLAGRPVTAEERVLIAKEGAKSIKPLLKSWLESAFFPKAFRSRVDMMLSTSGKRNSVDFNLPGNLAAYIASNKLPIETLLTADYCVGASGAQIECDTGAPFNAGVLGTRAFLMGHTGRFNLGRANSMLNAFACVHYPMSSTLQPPTPKDELITNFRVTSKDEADEQGAGGFGNGLACYGCHSQFSAHTQLFVKFNDVGVYSAAATGIQSKTLEFGRSDGGFFASHFVDPVRSADERSNMFGSEVQDLSQAAKVLAASESFKECMVSKVITHGMNLDSESAGKITREALQEIVKTLPANNASIQDFYLAVLSHSIVLDAFAKGVGENQ